MKTLFKMPVGKTSLSDSCGSLHPSHGGREVDPDLPPGEPERAVRWNLGQRREFR